MPRFWRVFRAAQLDHRRGRPYHCVFRHIRATLMNDVAERRVPDKVHEERVTLKELLGILRAGKRLIILTTLLITIAAAAAAWLLPKTYESSIVVLPVSSTPGAQSLSSLASQVGGGLASIFGMSLGTDYKRTQSIGVLKSDALLRTYIQQNNLLPVLYSSRWDSQLKRWKDPQHAPTLWMATRRFQKSIRTIAVDDKTGLVTLTVAWHDPHLAASWANGLVEMTNDSLRNKAIDEADRDIAYLNQEAAKTNVLEVKQAIFTVMQNELDQSMLARGTKEYAVTIIDPATAPEKAAWPSKPLWIIAGLFIGLLSSCFVVILRASID